MQIQNSIYNGLTRMIASGIAVVSPSRGISYLLGRENFRSYTAGSMRGPNKRWIPRNKSGDAEIKQNFNLIMARCRDMARNNPYIKGVLGKICNNVVRAGIRPQARVRINETILDEKLNRKLEGRWKKWSRKKYIDLSGHDSIASIQKLVLRHIWTDGEVLVHRVWDKSLLKKGIIPFRLEVLECDLLANHIDGDQGNGIIAKRGIGFDKKTGRPVKYYILPAHPGDYQFLSSRQNVIEVSASDIIHIFEKERASQTHGVSWFASIVMEAFDLSEYQSFERIGAKVAAAFGVFVKTQYPELMGGGSPLAGTGQDATKVLPDYIEPGRIQTLPMGTEIQIASHKRPGETYAPYVKQSLKGMSAGSATSYSTFSNDYSDSSYSADRAAKLEERLSFEGQQGFLNEKLNDDLWQWFMQGIFLAGLENIADFSATPDKYTEAVEWQTPGWTWVDPLKDSKAAETDLNNSITTRKKLLASRGEDFDETVEQLVYEETRLLELNKLKAENKKYGE